jgi:hypothetical protein
MKGCDVSQNKISQLSSAAARFNLLTYVSRGKAISINFENFNGMEQHGSSEPVKK